MSKVTFNLDGFETLKNRIESLDSESLEVGWFESAKYNDGNPVAGVAAIQEFGSPSNGIPPRPFFRPTIEDSKDSWVNIVKGQYEKVVVGGSSSEQALEMLGLKVVGDVKKSIASVNSPALSPVTIALRKQRDDGVKIGRSTVRAVAAAIRDGKTGAGELGDQSYPNKKPLNDTGYMLATLTHNVRAK